MTTTANSTPTPPFRKGGDNVLVEALNERQRRRDAEDTDPLATGGPFAISSAEVLEVLEGLGMAEGFDETATNLFFGQDGRIGYVEVGDELAVQTHGGFVFADPESGGIYTITATRLMGDSGSASTPRPLPFRTDDDGFLRELLDKLFGRRLYSPPRESSRQRRRSSLQWRVSASAMGYEVQPRFYEDIGFMDLVPLAEHVDDPADAGLVSLYPVDTVAGVSINTGTITAASADEALELADKLGAAMASAGVLCDPRVVLMETHDLPLLPHQARNESLHDRRTPVSEPDAEEDGDLLSYGAFLGAPHGLIVGRDHGHRVRRRRSSLVPEQNKAGWLACRASEYSAYEDRVCELQARLDDPRVPERRKESLRRHLARDAAIRDQAYQALADESGSLAGLLLSVLEERRELAREAQLRRMGV